MSANSPHHESSTLKFFAVLFAFSLLNEIIVIVIIVVHVLLLVDFITCAQKIHVHIKHNENERSSNIMFISQHVLKQKQHCL